MKREQTFRNAIVFSVPLYFSVMLVQHIGYSDHLREAFPFLDFFDTGNWYWWFIINRIGNLSLISMIPIIIYTWRHKDRWLWHAGLWLSGVAIINLAYDIADMDSKSDSFSTWVLALYIVGLIWFIATLLKKKKAPKQVPSRKITSCNTLDGLR